VHDELESLSGVAASCKGVHAAIRKDGAGLDAADSLMAKRLAEEVEMNALKSKAVQEMDERMKQGRDEEASELRPYAAS
jgi:hypothetical protein